MRGFSARPLPHGNPTGVTVQTLKQLTALAPAEWHRNRVFPSSAGIHPGNLTSKTKVAGTSRLAQPDKTNHTSATRPVQPNWLEQLDETQSADPYNLRDQCNQTGLCNQTLSCHACKPGCLVHSSRTVLQIQVQVSVWFFGSGSVSSGPGLVATGPVQPDSHN